MNALIYVWYALNGYWDLLLFDYGVFNSFFDYYHLVDVPKC